MASDRPLLCRDCEAVCREVEFDCRRRGEPPDSCARDYHDCKLYCLRVCLP